MKRIFLLIVSAAVLGTGCGQKNADQAAVSREPGNVIRVNVDAAESLPELKDGFDLTKVFRPVGEMCPGEEPETYLGSGVQFSYFDESSVLAHDNRSGVLRLSISDGSFIQAYGRQGRGPGEYLRVQQAFYRDGSVYVSDELSKTNVYDTEGHFLRGLQLRENTQFCSLGPLGKDAFLLNYSTPSGKPQLFDVVDADLHILRESKFYPDETDLLEKGGIRVGYSYRFGDEDCVVAGDTTYRVTLKKEEPCLYYAAKRGEMRSKQAFMTGHWLFLEVGYKDHNVRTVVDTKRWTPVFTVREQMVMGTAYTRDGKPVPYQMHGEEYAFFGIPVEKDGQTLYLWPVFADRGLLICRSNVDSERYYCFRVD